jgi:phytanoyl-CoA hydroxylase
MIGMVQPYQIEQMDTLGFTVFDRVFAADVLDEVTTSILAFEEAHQKALVAAGGTSGISRAEEITFTDHLAEQSPVLEAFVKREEFVEICKALIGDNVCLYWNQSVFKKPEGERIFPWHQDDAYTPVTPAPYLTLWVALNDATLENGCVSVLPGSHKGGLRPHVQSPIGLVGYPADAEYQGIPVPVSAGSVVAFWSLTLHKSGANRSKGPRNAYVVQYAPIGLKKKET